MKDLVVALASPNMPGTVLERKWQITVEVLDSQLSVLESATKNIQAATSSCKNIVQDGMCASWNRVLALRNSRVVLGTQQQKNALMLVFLNWIRHWCQSLRDQVQQLEVTAWDQNEKLRLLECDATQALLAEAQRIQMVEDIVCHVVPDFHPVRSNVAQQLLHMLKTTQQSGDDEHRQSGESWSSVTKDFELRLCEIENSLRQPINREGRGMPEASSKLNREDKASVLPTAAQTEYTRFSRRLPHHCAAPKRSDESHNTTSARLAKPSERSRVCTIAKCNLSDSRSQKVMCHVVNIQKAARRWLGVRSYRTKYPGTQTDMRSKYREMLQMNSALETHINRSGLNDRFVSHLARQLVVSSNIIGIQCLQQNCATWALNVLKPALNVLQRPNLHLADKKNLLNMTSKNLTEVRSSIGCNEHGKFVGFPETLRTLNIKRTK